MIVQQILTLDIQLHVINVKKPTTWRTIFVSVSVKLMTNMVFAQDVEKAIFLIATKNVLKIVKEILRRILIKGLVEKLSAIMSVNKQQQKLFDE